MVLRDASSFVSFTTERHRITGPRIYNVFAPAEHIFVTASIYWKVHFRYQFPSILMLMPM